ncbi:MAG: hypothetical protein AAF297_05350 [Planctomycetota bacterium]
MHIAREYDTAPQANAAARHLLEHGIVAGVVYTSLRRRELEPGLGLNRATLGAFRVLLANQSDSDDAELLLGAFDEEVVELDDGWESQADVDVTKLDASLAPACPACDAVLPLVNGLEACPACGASVELAGLIAERHGPEVLADLMTQEDAGDWLDPAVLVAADLPCGGCGRGLGGLPAEGACPWCGRAYSKADMVRKLFAEG